MSWCKAKSFYPYKQIVGAGFSPRSCVSPITHLYQENSRKSMPLFFTIPLCHFFLWWHYSASILMWWDRKCIPLISRFVSWWFPERKENNTLRKMNRNMQRSRYQQQFVMSIYPQPPSFDRKRQTIFLFLVVIAKKIAWGKHLKRLEKILSTLTKLSSKRRLRGEWISERGISVGENNSVV